MSAFILYPAIDLRAGKVVRLTQGDPARKTVYGDDPAEAARRWMAAGARWLHVVNLDGAFGDEDSANRAALHGILRAAARLDAHVQFGGGLRSLDAVGRALALGVGRVVVGTMAMEDPRMVAAAIDRHGPDRVAAGIDARDGIVQTRGWQAAAGMRADELADRLAALGVRTAIVTDIARDGMGTGLNLSLSRELMGSGRLDVIASGGVQALADVQAAYKAGTAGVIVGRALYEGTLDLETALKEVADAGAPDHSMP